MGSKSKKRIEELEALINSPELNDFLEGVKLESAHQTEKWGKESEATHFPETYSNVMTMLMGKQVKAMWNKDKDKYKHHLITLAAVCYNAHRQIEIEGTNMHESFNPKDEAVTQSTDN